jgi:hypothetical protein
MVLASSGASIAPARALLSTAKTARCIVGVAMKVGSALGWRWWLLRGLLHCGMAVRFVGCRALL